MKKTQNRKIMAALKDLNDGMTTREIAKKYGTTHGTISKWKLKYGTKMQKMDNNIPSGNENGSMSDTLVPSGDENIPSGSISSIKTDNNIPSEGQNIPSFVPESEIPPEGGWFNGIFYDPIDPDYDYDDDCDDLLKEYFKTHDRNDVSGIYFDENGKLKIKTK